MKINALTKKVNTFTVGQSINATNTFIVDSCSICVSPMHLAHNCPSMLTFAEYSREQVNAFNDYRKQSNGRYSEAYNPGWRNHPNFSWKQNQLVNQGGASHHAHNQYPPRFPPMVPYHGRSTQPASTFAYQAPTQAPTLISQSLEETFRDFMKMTSQSISDVRSATKVNS
jgi:hypothetical protein